MAAVAILASHAVLGVLIGLIPFWFRHRFYLKDDMENQFLPMFYHIGRLLRDGEFPTLTLASWYGSNIVGEFQFAIFNPISLATYALLPSIGNYETAAALQASLYYAILTPGCFVLARSFGLDRGWSALTALVIACGNFLSYWAASNWFPILSSFAWFVWAWALLRLAHRSRRDWLLAVVFAYLTITSGFPHTILMLGLVCLLTAVERWREASRFGPPLTVLLALATATLISAVPLLAVAAVGSLSTRPNHVYNGDFLTPNLRDVLQASSPLHFGMMNIYGGFQQVRTPIFFAAWFLAPLATLLDWKRFNWRQGSVATLIIIGAFLLFALQGPEDFSVLRYFLRWLPYLHVALVLLLGLAATQVGFAVTPYRVTAAACVAIFGCATSLQVTPERWGVLIPAGGGVLFGVLAFAGLGNAMARLRLALVAVLSFGAFIGTHWLIRENTNFGGVGFPTHSTGAADLVQPTAPATYSIYLGPAAYGNDAARVAEFRTGFQFLEFGANMVNGYTGIGHRPLSTLLCMEWAGQTCPDAARHLFETEPETGRPFVDLFRIDKIIVHKGRALDALRPNIGEPWRLDFDGQFTQRFVRDLAPLPGSLAWASPGLDVAQVDPATAKRTTLTVSSVSGAPTRVVFARLWWPGYHAKLNGTELSVHAASGIFAAVDLPVGAKGTLSLTFRPPFLRTGLALAGLGAILAVFVFAMYGRLTRPDRSRKRAERP